MEKLNFEQLKKETVIESKNEYSAKLSLNQNINTPMLKILFDYFNMLNDKKKLQKDQGFKIHGFVSANNTFIENLPESANGNLNVKVALEYKDEFMIFVVLSRFVVDGEWISTIGLTSNKATYLSSEFIYKKIIYGALAHSNLKGSYFIMPPNELAWDKRELEKRGFEDIYLPESTMDDLRLYTGLFEKKEELMRYLLAGTPGTGKTEATLALSNILKQKGVTIIKTVVCDALKEKIELAELLAPCLIIFDDIDMSLGSRNKGGASRSLGNFLDAMDGTDKVSKGVGIIATTNSIQLLDPAARRPGRFDKIMSFDSITKQNLKDIVLKSLRSNFGYGKNHPSSKIFSDNIINNMFYDNKITGSHVYSIVNMIMRKVDILEKWDYTVDWIISEIEQELKTLNTISNSNYLKDERLKGEDNSKKTGFQLDYQDAECDEDEYCVDECIEEASIQRSHSAPSDDDFISEEGMPGSN